MISTAEYPKVSEKWVEVSTNEVVTIINVHDVKKKGVRRQQIKFLNDETEEAEEVFVSVFMTFYKRE